MQIREMTPHSLTSIPGPSWRASAHATGMPIITRNILVSDVRIDDETSIAAFDIETGKERWKNSDAGGTENVPAFLQSSGHILLSNAGKGFVYGIDPSNGRSLWKLRIAEEPAYVAEFITKKNMLFTVGRKKLSAFSIDSGEKTGQTEIVQERKAGDAGDAIVSLCADGTNIYLVCFSEIIAVRMDSLQPVWRFEAGRNVYFGNRRRKPACYQTLLIVAGEDFTHSPSETFFVLDAVTGEKVCFFSPADGIGNFDPVVIDGCLLHGYRLSLLDLDSRQIAWESNIIDAQPNPCVFKDHICIPSAQGFIYRIDIKTGISKEIIVFPWKYRYQSAAPDIPGGLTRIPTRLTSTLLFHNGFFYFGIQDAETDSYALYKIPYK